jgi:hypothetical protein
MTRNKRWDLRDPQNKKFKWNHWISGFFIAPTVMFLGLIDFVSEPVSIFDLICTISSIIVFGAFALALHSLDKHRGARSIELDYDLGVIKFRKYTFFKDFRGNKAKEKVELPFKDFYKSYLNRTQGDAFIELTTELGGVIIGGYSDIEEIATCFEEIVTINQETNPNFEAEMTNAPRPKTAWYGWVILFGAVAIVAYLGWIYMYAQN